LAVNGAYDATDLVAKLRAYHNAAQTSDDKKKADLKYEYISDECTNVLYEYMSV